MTDISEKAVREQQKQELSRLLLESSDELDSLGSMVSEFNLFEAMGMIRQEIRHSHFLSTLFDPKASHGLGPLFFEKLFARLLHDNSVDEKSALTLLDIELCDYHDLKVFRERKQIDLLLVSEANKQVFAIENKIGAGEHGDQLQRYESTVRQLYPDYKSALVFLSPDGKEASQPNWLSLSYRELLEVLEQLIKTHSHRITPAARIGMEHYITLFKRHFMEDNEIAELCNKIYIKHRSALDLIFSHCQQSNDNREARVDFIENKLGQSLMTLGWEPDVHSLQCRRYACSAWFDNPKMMTSDWTSSGRILLMEFVVAKEITELKIVLGSSSDPDFRKDLRDKLAASELQSLRSRKIGNSKKWTLLYSTQLNKPSTIEDGDDEEITAEIGANFQTFVSNDWPKIKRAVDGVLSEIEEGPIR